VAICFAVLPPIAQDPHYHAFADGRTLHGVPNFWNVISNIPFFLVALYGIRALRSRTAFVEPGERTLTPFCSPEPSRSASARLTTISSRITRAWFGIGFR